MVQVATKAYRVASALLRAFRSRDNDILKVVFKANVWLILNYASAVWDPFLRIDVNHVEREQMHFTKEL